LVTFVTRVVKSVTLPITFWEKVCIPTATDAAKSEPGRFGTEGMLLEEEGVDEGPVPGVEVGKDRPKVGSYRPHQVGTNIGPVKTRRVRLS
jgi:hypothetical protein